MTELNSLNVQLKYKDSNNKISFKQILFRDDEHLFIYIESFNAEPKPSWKNIIDFKIID